MWAALGLKSNKFFLNIEGSLREAKFPYTYAWPNFKESSFGLALKNFFGSF
jgi:hypothetical protein